eukprot:3159528-Amphidinium_carterae.1
MSSKSVAKLLCHQCDTHTLKPQNGQHAGLLLSKGLCTQVYGPLTSSPVATEGDMGSWNKLHKTILREFLALAEALTIARPMLAKQKYDL